MFLSFETLFMKIIDKLPGIWNMIIKGVQINNLLFFFPKKVKDKYDRIR